MFQITCWRCGTNFCWLCGKRLDKQNPYSHFNIVGGDCFGALFQVRGGEHDFLTNYKPFIVVQGVDPGEEEGDELDQFDDEDEGWQAFVFGL